ncbi:hypothetical protein AGLY_003044 [Aphis glycines]|uniref:Uncharacterized protein n=1 Tax=Aphis glycines TaxID=307491 RepID=A0A6G0U2G5_APHGL|nr:hypothetical protein AGLY_003044 [Aphis glycines]
MVEKSKNVRKQLFTDSWLEDDRFKGWLRAIPDQPSKANCIVCNLIFGTKKSDIIRHSESQRHIRSVSSLKNVTKLNFKPDSEVVKMQTQVQKTELMLAHYVACHNLSFRSIDHLSQLPRLMMNDSKIAQQISIKRTKCVKFIKNVLASVVEDNIVKEMENKKFSIYLDETTDIANIKVLAILVKYIFNNRIQTHLLDLVPVDADHGTAKGLYILFSKSLDKLKLSTDNIIGYCADNASVMMGSKESFKTHLLNDNSNIIWRIKINPEKSFNVIFTLRRNDSPPVQLQGVDIPKTSQVKYLGLILDKRLTWGPHLKSKHKTLNNRLHLLRPILKSKMSIHTKSILYKSLLRPIWAYGMQIWGCAKPSQILSTQAFQSISLRLIASAPWYITNKALHKDLKIDTVNQLAKHYYSKFHAQLRYHPNPLISHLSSLTLPDNPPRRLKRRIRN